MSVELITRGLPCIRCGQSVESGDLTCSACQASPRPPQVLEDARTVEWWTVEGTPVVARGVRHDYSWTSDEWPNPRREAEDFIRRSQEVYVDLVLSHQTVLHSARVVVPA